MAFRIPGLKESLHIFGESSRTLLSETELSWLIWNVYKGQRSQELALDLPELSQGKSFVLLQEAVDSDILTLLKENNPDHHWKLGISFEFMHNGLRTGVATGSVVQALQMQFLRSKQREFLIWTPKSTLISEYEISGTKEKLMVVNTHAINFVGSTTFQNFLNDLVPILSAHIGPMVVAGDFNTWSAKRLEVLFDFTKALGLKHTVFENDDRFLKLDHIFWRGFDLVDARLHTKISSSDHFPLELKLKFRG